MDIALGARLICLCDDTWDRRGRAREGFSWNYLALRATHRFPELFSERTRLIASACHEVRDAALLPRLIDEAHALLADAKTPPQLMEIHDALGYLMTSQGKTQEARGHFQESDRQRRASELRYTPVAGANIAEAYLAEGDIQAALETIATFAPLALPGQRRILAIFEVITAKARLALKQYEEATAMLRKTLADFEAIQEHQGITCVKVLLAQALSEQGEVTEPSRLAREGGRAVWQEEETPYVQRSLNTLALCALRQNNPRRAWCLLGLADQSREGTLPFLTPYLRQQDALFRAHFPEDLSQDYRRLRELSPEECFAFAYDLPDDAPLTPG